MFCVTTYGGCDRAVLLPTVVVVTGVLCVDVCCCEGMMGGEEGWRIFFGLGKRTFRLPDLQEVVVCTCYFLLTELKARLQVDSPGGRCVL